MRGADKSLARPTSRCHRMESRASLERGADHVPNCNSSLVTEAERKHVRRRMQFQHGDASCLQVFFFFLQAKVPKEIHATLKEPLGEHAPSYATVKNWVAQFKRDVFTSDVPHPGRPKTVTTLEIIDQIHELILEDHRISAKSIAEQLGTSRGRVGSIIHEDLDVQKLSAKWVPKCLNMDQKCQRCVVWATFGIFLARSKWFPVTIGGHGRNLVISLWPGATATINGVAAHWLTQSQKIPSAKIRWKSSCLDSLGSRRHPPRWISSKGLNYQCRVLLIPAGATEVHFEGKTPREGHQGDLVLARRYPSSPGTCNPEETDRPELPMSSSPTLFSRSGPVRLPPVPWTKKTIERSPFFIQCGGHCCCRELVGQTTFWIFFEWFAKVKATG